MHLVLLHPTTHTDMFGVWLALLSDLKCLAKSGSNLKDIHLVTSFCTHVIIIDGYAIVFIVI